MTIIFNFTHKFNGLNILVDAEVTCIEGVSHADSDWDSIDYFHVDLLSVGGRILGDEDLKTIGLTLEEVERQFEVWVDTTKAELDIDDYLL